MAAPVIEHRPLDQLRPHPRNARTHSPAQVEQLAASMREFGFTAPVLVDGAGQVLAGHGRLLAARQLGLATVPCVVLDHLTPDQARAYLLADNRLAENAGWDLPLLKIELQELSLTMDLAATGFDTAALAKLLPLDLDPLDDSPPPQPPEPITRPGDCWQLGCHRLACGDATQPGTAALVLAGETPDLVCMDPPYCSGGFQECGRAAGSVGTQNVKKQIANDTLSTRGFMALLRQVLGLYLAPYLYSFTDWRMWVHLFDLAEAAGYGVRNMLVWDKGYQGMGRGWRAQHELVLWGVKQTPPWPAGWGGHGNVLQCSRSGNHHHTTEKPLELLEILLQNLPFAQRVVDPFCGSGTTLLACERLGRQGLGIELDPSYCDTAVLRWQQLTGGQAVEIRSGRKFGGPDD